MKDATTLLTRCEQNPIMHVKDFPGVAQLYNPTVFYHEQEYVMLVSVVEHGATKGKGRDVGQTKIARSKDGVHFCLEQENFITVDEAHYPYGELYHFIDNRVSKIDDTYYIITPVLVNGFDSPVGLLGQTKDFKSYEAIEIITQPKNRGASLFPEKIGGKYYKLDRPGGGKGGYGDIWLSSSPDLIHWGGFRPVLAPNYRYWNSQKIGPTPPIKTEKGWLEIIHGVFSPAGGSSYHIGAILLDLEDPTKIIGRTNSPLLSPEMDYELHGNCPNTVFVCGALPNHETDELRIYYGACDNFICLATGKISEIVDACLLGL